MSRSFLARTKMFNTNGEVIGIPVGQAFQPDILNSQAGKPDLRKNIENLWRARVISGHSASPMDARALSWAIGRQGRRRAVLDRVNASNSPLRTWSAFNGDNVTLRAGY